MKKIITYTKKTTNAEKIAINIINKKKNTKIILQYNIEIIFMYKKKLCKEKECKLTIKHYNNNIKQIIRKNNNELSIELKK